MCLVSNLETCLASRHGFSCLSLGSVSTLVVLSRLCLEFPCLVMSHVSCLMTVSLSGIVKCLFCAETLTFLAEVRPQGPFIHCLLTYCKVAVLVVAVVLWL